MQDSFYMFGYAVVAIIPDMFKDYHHFNELRTGLTFVPPGVRIIAGGFYIGKIMDYNYQIVVGKIG